MEEKEKKEYLIPANSKRGMLIFNMFRPIDLIIFCTGVVITLMMLLLISDGSFWVVMFKLAPVLICTFLVLPVPNYHNVRILIREVFQFFNDRKIYLWRGWCISSESEK